MFDRQVSERALEQILQSPLGPAYPKARTWAPTPEACHGMARQLETAWDPEKGRMTRTLTLEEQEFIHYERLWTKVSYPYWGERYAVIVHPDKGKAPMFPLFESQRLILAAIAEQEAKYRASGHPDGLICNILKGRQLGASTLCQSILAHRVTTQSYTKTLIASDVPQNSGSAGLFGMLELTVAHTPWWLKPGERFHTKDTNITFTNGSLVNVESGKSMKGALQEEGGSKGQMGRSKTYTCAHLSELSTWENPGQIDDSLMPAIPATPRTFMAKESTAKGRSNWWHHEWQATAQGFGRSFNIFIPWYAERSKYWMPCPPDWVIDPETLAYAQRVEAEGSRWMRRTYRLSREQLYWYYCQRRAAEEKGVLYKFLEEYPAEPEEAFQYSGRSIFTPAQIDYLRRRARPARALYHVRPTPLIAALRDQTLTEADTALEPTIYGPRG